MIKEVYQYNLPNTFIIVFKDSSNLYIQNKISTILKIKALNTYFRSVY